MIYNWGKLISDGFDWFEISQSTIDILNNETIIIMIMYHVY